MRIDAHGDTLTAYAPAKLNLYLEVLGRRPDGYHDLETVMQAIDLCDTLTFRPAEGAVRFTTDSPDIPADGTNLVVRAAEALRRETGTHLGAEITLTKAIPVGAGMGGGSSDCAATLLALNRLWQLSAPRETLHKLAASLGSDIAFFLTGGAALCHGRGEIVTALDNLPVLTFVIAYPSINVSTAQVYKNLPPCLTKGTAGATVFLESLRNCEGSGRAPRFFNRLEEVTTRLCPELVRLRERMIESGLKSVTMTGSGSAFFGCARDRKEADRIAEQLRRTGVRSVYIARSGR